MIIFFLVSSSAFGCAVGPALTPIADLRQRFDSQGFSVLPPRGENWYVMWQEFRGSPVIVFHKVLRERIIKQGHTIAAAVHSVKYEDILAEQEPTSPRFRPLEYKISLDNYLGWDCVKYSFTAEDYGVPHFPGTVFILSGEGFFFLHPHHPTIVIHIVSSQRFIRGERPIKIESEVQPFLKSLLFTSIRGLETGRLSPEEMRRRLEALTKPRSIPPIMF